MKVNQLIFHHNNCGGVILLKSVYTSEEGKVVFGGVCRACSKEVWIDASYHELFPPRIKFDEMDTVRLHGMSVCWPSELLLEAPNVPASQTV